MLKSQPLVIKVYPDVCILRLDGWMYCMRILWHPLNPFPLQRLFVIPRRIACAWACRARHVISRILRPKFYAILHLIFFCFFNADETCSHTLETFFLATTFIFHLIFFYLFFAFNWRMHAIRRHFCFFFFVVIFSNICSPDLTGNNGMHCCKHNCLYSFLYPANSISIYLCTYICLPVCLLMVLIFFFSFLFCRFPQPLEPHFH